jgi:bleomycin hydrolase
MRLRTSSGWAVAALILLGGLSRLAADDGALDPEFTKSLRDSVKMDGAMRALHNALTGNDAKKLAVNRDILWEHNDIFNHKVKTKGITDQEMSGRCWMFAGLNVLRPAVIEKYKLDDFEFSESYLAFWDKLEKANFFLETMIELSDRKPFDRELDYFLKEPTDDGGWWSFVVALVDKYGVMPKDAMPETFPSAHTNVMNAVLATKLRADAAQLRHMAAEKKPVAELREAKRKMLGEVYRMLVLNYGQPPAEFTYRYVDKDKKISPAKKYTPQSFYKEFVGVDLSQYVTIGNDPTQPYEKPYRLRRVRNMIDAPDVIYVNMPIDTLKSVAAKSILDGSPVIFYADAKKDMDVDKGIMQANLYDYGAIYGVDLALDKADRMKTREGSANHAMLIIGVDMQGDKPVKWQVENSWGKKHGKDGTWSMYDKWFDANLYCVVVKKAYLTNEVLKLFQEEPVELPPWAPMNAPSD